MILFFSLNNEQKQLIMCGIGKIKWKSVNHALVCLINDFKR